MTLGEILSDKHNRDYAIKIMSEKILNDDLTSNNALKKRKWLIRWPEIKEGGQDQYLGDFPEDMKEKAISLADEKKKSQTIPGFYDDYVVNEMVNQIIRENIRPTEAQKKYGPSVAQI